MLRRLDRVAHDPALSCNPRRFRQERVGQRVDGGGVEAPIVPAGVGLDWPVARAAW